MEVISLGHCRDVKDEVVVHTNVQHRKKKYLPLARFIFFAYWSHINNCQTSLKFKCNLK